MVRGPKKHLKRLNAPKHWMLAKMGGIWAPKPAAGPHKSRECLPISLILRNRLKYALTRKESQMIVMQKLIKVDGKTRTEVNFPAGFMGASSCEPHPHLLLLAARVRGVPAKGVFLFGPPPHLASPLPPPFVALRCLQT